MYPNWWNKGLALGVASTAGGQGGQKPANGEEICSPISKVILLVRKFLFSRKRYDMRNTFWHGGPT